MKVLRLKYTTNLSSWSVSSKGAAIPSSELRHLTQPRALTPSVILLLTELWSDLVETGMLPTSCFCFGTLPSHGWICDCSLLRFVEVWRFLWLKCSRERHNSLLRLHIILVSRYISYCKVYRVRNFRGRVTNFNQSDAKKHCFLASD